MTVMICMTTVVMMVMMTIMVMSITPVLFPATVGTSASVCGCRLSSSHNSYCDDDDDQ